MIKKECANLLFILTHPNTNKVLYLGKNENIIFGDGKNENIIFGEIQKSEDLFSNLKTFNEKNDELITIGIPIYLYSMNNTLELNTFLNPDLIYDLQIIMNNTNYYAKCKILEPDLSNCDDLYGDKYKYIVYTVNLELTKKYYLTDYISSTQIGASYHANFRMGKYFTYPNTIKGYYFSLQNQIAPVSINNTGGNENGIRLDIEPSTLLINPILINRTTGYEMKINVTVYPEQLLIIDTENKTIKLDNQYLYGVKRLKDNWLVLQEGYNTIQFNADSGADNCKVTLSFRNKVRAL